MALTANVQSAGEDSDNNYYIFGTLAFASNDYTTGGYDLTAKISGAGAKLERITYMAANGGGYVWELDQANQKLIVRRQKDPAAAGGADIPLPEVANGADLSGQTPVFFALGQ